MAGGFSSGVSKDQPLRVIRYGTDEKKQVIALPVDDSSLKTFKVIKGDVIVVPHMLLSKNNFDYETSRIPGDNIFYPSSDGNVYVIGAVNKPGPIPYTPGFNFKQYVGYAGPNSKSSKKNMSLVKWDGKKEKLSSNTVIDPGDTIMVAERYWKPETITSWLSTIASLTLTTLIIQDRLQKN